MARTWPIALGEWSSSFKVGRGPTYQALTDSILFEGGAPVGDNVQTTTSFSFGSSVLASRIRNANTTTSLNLLSSIRASRIRNVLTATSLALASNVRATRLRQTSTTATLNLSSSVRATRIRNASQSSTIQFLSSVTPSRIRNTSQSSLITFSSLVDATIDGGGPPPSTVYIYPQARRTERRTLRKTPYVNN